MKIVITLIATVVIDYKEEAFDIDKSSSEEDQKQSIKEQCADGVRNYPVDFLEHNNPTLEAIVTLVE